MTDAKITQKIIVKGTLQLDSPLLIGSGTEIENRKNEADIHVLKNKREQPFIPGTSLAGVLKEWFSLQNAEAADKLFGFLKRGNSKGNMPGVQSAIAIWDVVFKNGDAKVIVRDGVSIDGYTGISLKGKKYDYELVERGAKGSFLMMFTIRDYHEKQIPDLDLQIQLLVDKLYTGIRVGALTTKGFGNVSIPDITVFRYDFRETDNVKKWLLKQPSDNQYKGKKLKNDNEDTLVIEGEFSLQTSLLIRDYINTKINDIHLTAVPVMSKDEYLIPGTSFKGVLRHQAEKILSALHKPESWLDDLMGYSKDNNQKKSRFITNEIYFKENVVESYQTRNHIDRFTGGTIKGEIFTNKALWQPRKGKSILKSRFEILECKDWEAGLALFLLKDLWNGNIVLGGEKSIGRGVLLGHSATVAFKGKKYVIGENGKVTQEDREALEKLTDALIHKE